MNYPVDDFWRIKLLPEAIGVEQAGRDHIIAIGRQRRPLIGRELVHQLTPSRTERYKSRKSAIFAPGNNSWSGG